MSLFRIITQISGCAFLLIAAIILPLTPVYAQWDSLEYTVSTESFVATKRYAPLWMIANKYDIFEDTYADGLLRGTLTLPYRKANKWLSYAAGLDAIGKARLGNSRLQQAYLKVKIHFIELKIGSEQKTLETTKNPLSSGTMLTSGNARPIPGITGSFPEFVAVPYTYGYFEIKGHYSFGWLGAAESVKNAYLHEVSIYGRIGGPSPYKLYVGFIDVAQWGGTHRMEGKLPSSFNDYLKVILGLRSDDTTLIAEASNKLGNHIGLIDIGSTIDFKKHSLQLYTQVIFDDPGGFRFRNEDRLIGIALHSPKHAWLKGITYEFLHTRYQSGPGFTDPAPWDMGNFGFPYAGRDNYYNNYLYESGWAYKGAVLGNPFFTTDARADKYFGNYQEIERNGFQFAIINNRIIAHHLGFEIQPSLRWKYKAMITWTRNWGTYGGLNGGLHQWGSRDPNYTEDYLFDPPLDQWYMMAEATYSPSTHLSFTSRLAFDTGNMSNTTGLSLGACWNGVFSRKE